MRNAMISRLLPIVSIMLFPISLLGQSAELSGYVKDPQMGTVPNASVELRNEDTGAVSRTATNAEGIYILGGLNPGTYDATIQASGFRTLTRDSLVLEVEQRARMDVTLNIGAVTENINVEANVPVLDTDPGVS